MTSPPIIIVTPQELSQSLNPSLRSSAYWVNFTKVEMIPTIGKSRKILYAIDTHLRRHCAASSIPANTLCLD
jgi:hypothetical protein